MDQNIGGLQLALFELIWPADPWINWIRLVDDSPTPTFDMEALSAQDLDGQEACTGSLSEVV